MGLYAVVINHDEELKKQKTPVVYANDFNVANEESEEEFKRTLYSHFDNIDAIESSVSCRCGTANEAHQLNTIAECCNSIVTKSVSQPIESSMWLRAPKGVDSMISPLLLVMLTGYMAGKEFNFLEYFINTSYSFDANSISSNETRRKVGRLLQRNFTRGLNEFLQNFDEIIRFCMDVGIISIGKHEFWEFVSQNKKDLFPQCIPIPTKLCFVVESTTSGSYIDKPIAPAIEAALTISGIEHSAIPLKPIVIQNRTAKALLFMAKFHEDYAKQRIAQKQGLVRKHVLGGRINFTARGVITSIYAPHQYDDLQVPWGIFCQLMKYHIINKLKLPKWGNMTTKAAMGYLYAHVLQYDDRLNQIFLELIAESKYRGIPVTFHRN